MQTLCRMQLDEFGPTQEGDAGHSEVAINFSAGLIGTSEKQDLTNTGDMLPDVRSALPEISKRISTYYTQKLSDTWKKVHCRRTREWRGELPYCSRALRRNRSMGFFGLEATVLCERGGSGVAWHLFGGGRKFPSNICYIIISRN